MGMFCTHVQVNTERVICLVRAVFEQQIPSMPSPQLAFISSCAWPKISLHDLANCNSCPLQGASSVSTQQVIVNNDPGFPTTCAVAYLYLICGPTEPHPFSITDTSNSRWPQDCLFRHWNAALALPPPSITPSGFWPTRPCWQLLCNVHVINVKAKTSRNTFYYGKIYSLNSIAV